MAVAWSFQAIVATTVLSIGVVLVRRCLRERTVIFDAALYSGLLLSIWHLGALHPRLARPGHRRPTDLRVPGRMAQDWPAPS